MDRVRVSLPFPYSRFGDVGGAAWVRRLHSSRGWREVADTALAFVRRFV
jgi:hypothetical protein